MHWVWATGVDGKKVMVNLGAIPSLTAGVTEEGKAVTLLFLGGIAVAATGSLIYANTCVTETPEQLFALPKVQVGQVANGHDKPSAYAEGLAKAVRQEPVRAKKADRVSK